MVAILNFRIIMTEYDWSPRICNHVSLPSTAKDMSVLVTCCSNNNSYSVGKNSIKTSIDISFKLTINCYYAAANSA
jgi:hypothetical protein